MANKRNNKSDKFDTAMSILGTVLKTSVKAVAVVGTAAYTQREVEHTRAKVEKDYDTLASDNASTLEKICSGAAVIGSELEVHRINQRAREDINTILNW